MFAEDLMIIDRLRSEAINVQEPHFSGVTRLVTYAAQLKWLGGKFPIDVRCLPLWAWGLSWGLKLMDHVSRLEWNSPGILRLALMLRGQVSCSLGPGLRV
jgi:hypothetical protein